MGKKQGVSHLPPMQMTLLFNTRYLGKVQNNDAGRTAFWNELITYNKELEQLQAIENFVSDDLLVEQGKDKKSVTVTNPVTPVCAMHTIVYTNYTCYPHDF